MPPRFPPSIAVSDFAVVSEDESGVSILALGIYYPCLVRGPSTAVAINRRRRSGTATLCGVSEFSSPSSPPKKYQTQTLSGNVAGCSYNAMCATPGANGGFAYKWSGTYKFDPATCAITNTSIEQFFPSDGVSFCGAAASPTVTTPMSSPFQPSNIDTASEVTTPTTDSWNYPGTCSLSNQRLNGSAVATLTDPDTDLAAIARLQATTPWVGFGTCPTPPTCCLASWQLRTTGFSFDYGDAQFRIAASGLLASQLYCAAVDIFRRPWGVPPYVLFETIFVFGATDGAGNLQLDGDVPNAPGFETYFDNPRYFPPIL